MVVSLLHSPPAARPDFGQCTQEKWINLERIRGSEVKATWLVFGTWSSEKRGPAPLEVFDYISAWQVTRS